MSHTHNVHKFDYNYFGAIVKIRERLIIRGVKMARIQGDFPKGFYPNKSLALMNALHRI